MNRPFDNKFNIGDEVAYDGKMGWITGVDLYLGYNVRLWQYTITAVHYRDDSTDNPKPWECGGDTDRAEKVKEDTILTIQEFVDAKKKRLQSEIVATQKKLDELKAMNS